MPRNRTAHPSQIEFVDSSQRLTVQFETKSLADAFGQMDFYSRLLHSLAPDETGVWVEVNSPRVNAYILGWPNSVRWIRDAERNFYAEISKNMLPALETFKTEVTSAIKGLVGTKSSAESLMRPTYNFKISIDGTVKEYHFLGRAREVCAFCVLYDMQPHPRNHLEVNTRQTSFNTWPVPPIPTVARRTYGDPSKTVDELRNQGFPRPSDIPDSSENPSLLIERSEYDGGHQEHYHLVNRDQRLKFQVGRSSISPSIKRTLYASYKHRCNICHQTFSEEYLAPDHRIPAIVEADDLTSSNFSTKLQTLCRSCNQVKREMCKKCPFQKNCRECPWAFPEKHSIGPEVRNQIFKKAKADGISPDELLLKALKKV